MVANEIKVPFLEVWQPDLTKTYPPETVEKIIAEIYQNYKKYLSYVSKIKSKELKNHLEGSILPVLSLYLGLKSIGLSQESAIKETQRLFFLTLKKIRQQQLFLGKLPFAYSIYRAMIRPVMKIGFPDEGFQTDWIETSKLQLAFNMTGCFYLNILTEFSSPELTQVFCNADDYIYTDVSPHIGWERTQTMGRGGDFCDFRFVRK
jgi:hypothetical protein